MQWVEFVYYAKKAFALFPGILEPRCAPVFVRHYARRTKTRRRLRKLLDALVGIGFYLWIPWRARVIQKRFGKDDAWRLNAISIARERFADPNDLALFRIERAQQLDGYIRRFEDAAFNKIINPLGWSRDCVLVDKRRFYARCAEFGIRHPETVAVIEAAQLVEFTPRKVPLLVKPSHGEGGRGVTHLPAEISAIEDDANFLRATLPYCRSGARVFIVQTLIDNHPVLANYAVDALITARLTTMLNAAGEAELVSTVLRMPSLAGPVIDNMKAGGLIMPIDFETGRAGRACKGYGGGDYSHHPVSGAALEDLVLPDWDAAISLVAQAHRRAFEAYALIGWDVAFSQHGPVLIEGNAKPGVLMPQRSARRGLAEQRYGELLAWHLDRRADA